MRNCSLPVMLLLALLVLPAPAAAQERGQTGIVMGFPATVGFLWHASDNLALRPEFTFQHTRNESLSNIIGGGSASSSNAMTIGTSVLWYMGKYDNVRTYVSPRFTYGHSSSKVENSNVPPAKSDVFSLTGSFGAQYNPTRKLAVFGEVGYGYNRVESEIKTPFLTTEGSSTTWATRASVGVVFYFGS